MSTLFALVLSLLAIFLILLVLVQRGRGGGLAGALGGMGGSSAFGAKAGDVFTRITIVTAAIWIVVCVAAVYWASHQGDALSGDGAVPASNLLPDDMQQRGPAGGPAAPADGAGGAQTTSPPAGTAPTSSGPASAQPVAPPPASSSSAPAESPPTDGK